MSRLKDVLNRRLFRDNGMLGPENPQGILNSSPELADVVRMQNGGGFYLGQAPALLQEEAGPETMMQDPMFREEVQEIGLTGAEDLQAVAFMAPPPDALSTDEAQDFIEEAPTPQAVVEAAETQAPDAVGKSPLIAGVLSNRSAYDVERGAARTGKPPPAEEFLFADGFDDDLIGTAKDQKPPTKITKERGKAPAEPTPPDQVALSELFNKRGAAEDSFKLNTMINVARRAEKIRQGRGTPDDLNDIKGEIAAVMPALEEDNVSEGLMTALLGLSIAEKGVAAGGKEALPGLINFYAQRRSEKMKRDQAISSTAITEYFSRGKENRAFEAALRTARADAEFDMREFIMQEHVKDSLDKETWTIGNAGQIQLPDNKVINYTPGQSITLNEEGRALAGQAGMQLVKPDTYDPETSGTGRLYTHASWLDMPTKEKKEFVEGDDYDIQVGLEDPIKVRIQGLTGVFWHSNWADVEGIPHEAQIGEPALRGAQEQYIGARRKIVSLIEDIEGLSEFAGDEKFQKGFTGVTRLKESLGTALIGLGVEGLTTDLGDYMLGGKDISSVGYFDARARLILARIVPIVLGESGRTISDADRQKVAKALGFNVEEREDGSYIITGTQAENFLINPEQILHALNETRTVLVRQLNQTNSSWKGFLATVGRLPEDPVEAAAMGVPVKAAEEEKAVFRMSDLPKNWEKIRQRHVSESEGRKLINLMGGDDTRYFSSGAQTD